MKFRPDAPLSEAARQRLARQGSRQSRTWWLRLRAFVTKDGAHWYCWRAGDDEPEPPVQ